MYDYEKLGVFYMGRSYDIEAGKCGTDPVLYDSKDLNTHAVIVGMTGSGKTGLGITMLEEAAIDGIPSIVIDPKGDLGNLLLTFPGLTAAEFRPWVEKGEATRKGMSEDEFAAAQADLWKKGLADWDQPQDRIQRYRDAVEVSLYTPGSDAGLQLTILKSLDAPPATILESADAMRERISAAVGGLLTLLDLNPDPLQSREHIFLSNILDNAWRAGRSLDLPNLIREVQNPPFRQIGIMDVDQIFPAADRLKLAMTINNVLASPSFAAWTRGEPLNIQKLLYTDAGKPRMSIISIAHMNDHERMFFVTLLLTEMITWMRQQSGTSSLRALLYMDEVFGYLPPTANPPSKIPMLTLLKQARAYGLGLILATQNPVDLDYKALSNAGTWFLGRLQTERDKMRVLDGLEGASSQAGAKFDRQKVERILSGLGNRVFLLNNVHEDAPVVMQTRWALSYLRGPLTRDQISDLMASRKESSAVVSRPVAPASRPDVAPSVFATPAPSSSTSPSSAGPVSASPSSVAPIVPAEIRQIFADISKPVNEIVYRPALLGTARMHFVDAKAGIDTWKNVARLAVIEDDVPSDPWDQADDVNPDDLALARKPADSARFEQLPSALTQTKQYTSWKTGLKNSLYREGTYTVPYCEALGLFANAGESTSEFQARLKHSAREERDLQIEKLRKKYGTKLSALQERQRKAEQAVEREKSQSSGATLTAAVQLGSSILGALFGRKLATSTNVTRATTTVRSATRAAEQKADVSRAQETVNAIQADREALEAELNAEIDRITDSLPDDVKVINYDVKPRKSDTTIDAVSLLWLPYSVSPSGATQPAWG
jgi:hypothetical protein